MGKRCSYTPGFHSSRVGCAGKKQWKTEEFEGEREEVSYVRGGVLLEMGNSNPQRPYGNLERGHFSDVRALSSRKLGTSKFRGKYGKQWVFSPHSTTCWLSASVTCSVCPSRRRLENVFLHVCIHKQHVGLVGGFFIYKL